MSVPRECLSVYLKIKSGGSGKNLLWSTFLVFSLTNWDDEIEGTLMKILNQIKLGKTASMLESRIRNKITVVKFNVLSVLSRTKLYINLNSQQ